MLSEYHALGGSKGDAKFDLSRGYITIIKEGVGIRYKDPHQKKRKAPTTRKAPVDQRVFDLHEKKEGEDEKAR